MSPAATLLVAWSAISLYAGLFYGVVHVLRRGASPEYRAFALLCSTHVGFAGAGAAAAEAATPAAATSWLAVHMCAGLLMGAAFFHFATTLTRGGLAPLVPTAWILTAVGVGATALGMSLHVPPDDTMRAAGFGLDAPRFEPISTVVGLAFSGLAILWSALGLLTLVFRARDAIEARVMLASTLPSLVIAAWNGVPGLRAEGPGWLVEQIGVLVALGAGLVLLRRFARAAGELQARTEALSTSYELLRRTQESLVAKEQLAAVGELSAVIAHEVRNPLAILKNAVAGLRQPTLGEADRRVLLGIVNEETDRLARLVRDLLAYARPLSPSRAPARLVDLAVRAWEDGRLAKVRGDVRLELDVGDALEVLVDREHAHLGLVNLIDNALAATNGRGVLHLRGFETRLEGRPAVALEVRDEGCGMDPQVLAKARDPFFTTRAAGTGLGLAIVERMVRGHDGTLEIESVPNVGTTATLTFPAPMEPSA